MPPPNKKAKHLVGARDNSLIRKQKQTSSKQTKERGGGTWEVMTDIMKGNSDILMNTKGQVHTLEYNKFILLVCYRKL